MPEPDDEVRDALPEELDVSAFVGPYQFPDNSRRRIQAALYAVVALVCLWLWFSTRGSSPVLVNGGILLAAMLLGLVAVYAFTSGWHLRVDERQALEAATRSVGFPVGHASAQLAWRGLRSRPTWRILCYSAEEPPLQRGFVMLDAIDGSIVSTFSESNPEDWSQLT